MSVNKNTIDNIHAKGLCNGCGTCYSVCPELAIDILPDYRLGTFIAVKNSIKCIKCGKCVAVCHSYDTLFQGNFLKEDSVGEYRRILYGYSTDDNIRINASSGGIVTSVLLYLMKEGEISGCILVKPFDNSPILYESFISKDIENIREYTGTRYFPIPVNKILTELKQCDGKYVIIGTPCQIHSIRLAEKIDPTLRDKIYLTFSVFCGGTPNFNAHRYIMRQYGIKENTIKSITRRNGWPGSNIFQIDTTKSIQISKRPTKWLQSIHHTIAFFPLFAVKRCILCNDRFGVFADISVGDAWLNRFSKDTKGTSLIITRSNRGDEIINAMTKMYLLNVGPITKKELILSQQIFSEYYKNFKTTVSTMIDSNTTKRFSFDTKCNRDFFWIFKQYLLIIGWKLTQREYLWGVLFIYGILFQFLWKIFSMMQKKQT